MAIWTVTVQDRRTHEVVDQAHRLTLGEALEVVDEMERIWQDDPVDVNMERQA